MTILGTTARPVNSRTGGLRLAVAWPGTGTAVPITDRGRTRVLPGDRQSPVRLIGEFTDPGSGHVPWPRGPLGEAAPDTSVRCQECGKCAASVHGPRAANRAD